MNIIRLQPDITGTVDWPTLSTSKKSVITVGVFDGMHKGHQEVIRTVVERAKQERCFSVVIMFDPRPAFVHGYAAEHGGAEVPEDVHDTQALTGVDERLRIMSAMHVDYVIIVDYNLEFAAKSYRFFLGQLVGKMGMRTLVLGEDARLGANREGTIAKIHMLSEGTGVFELVVLSDQGGHVRVPDLALVPAPVDRGEPEDPLADMSNAERRAWTKSMQSKEVRRYSSTNVRYLLAQGRMRAASEILGRPHGVEGTVIHGEERGRAIGFPTANVEEPTDGYLPVDGVYAGWLIDLGPESDYEATQRPFMEMDDASEDGISHPYSSGGVEHRLAPHSPYRWPAAISIGTKPTYSDKTGLHERVLEAYAITDDNPDLYGHRVRCEFVEFLRPQIKFDTTQELVDEMTDNVQETTRIIQGEIANM